jgi:hypothetical protein
LAKAAIGSEDHLPTQPLLSLNLGQQQIRPAFGAVHIARPQLRRQTIAFSIEQQ